MDPIQPSQPIISSEKSKKNLFVYIGLAILFLVIITGSIYVWQRVNRDSFQQEVPADWKTYKNYEYGFEIKYPDDWGLSEDEKFWGFGPNSIQEDTLFTVYITDSVPIIGKENPNQEIIKIENSTFNNFPAKAVYIKNISADETSVRLFIERDEAIISLGQPTLNDSDYPSDHKYNGVINQILSTFKFIESIDTSTWETYRNDEYGFEFKYPPELNLKEDRYTAVLTHEIPYENNGDCDMTGGSQIYKNLTDFSMSFQVEEGILYPKGPDGEYASGELSGAWLYGGAEGCGHILYYFPAGTNRTLTVV